MPVPRHAPSPAFGRFPRHGAFAGVRPAVVPEFASQLRGRAAADPDARLAARPGRCAPGSAALGAVARRALSPRHRHHTREVRPQPFDLRAAKARDGRRRQARTAAMESAMRSTLAWFTPAMLMRLDSIM